MFPLRDAAGHNGTLLLVHRGLPATVREFLSFSNDLIFSVVLPVFRTPLLNLQNFRPTGL